MPPSSPRGKPAELPRHEPAKPPPDAAGSLAGSPLAQSSSVRVALASPASPRPPRARRDPFAPPGGLVGRADLGAPELRLHAAQRAENAVPRIEQEYVRRPAEQLRHQALPRPRGAREAQSHDPLGGVLLDPREDRAGEVVHGER